MHSTSCHEVILSNIPYFSDIFMHEIFFLCYMDSTDSKELRDTCMPKLATVSEHEP